MTKLPEIELVHLEHGLCPGAESLNPRIATGSPLVRATLDIAWGERHPLAPILLLEDQLAAFSPSLRAHDCGGGEAYHVLRAGGARPPNGRNGGTDGFDGRLALAHLLEHLIIDLVSEILRPRRCSGFTGALREPEGRFDLVVECADPRVGGAVVLLSMAWVALALTGRPLGSGERDVITAARAALVRNGRPLHAAALAKELRWDEGRASRALRVLTETGLLSEPAWQMNFSGIPQFRVSPP